MIFFTREEREHVRQVHAELAAAVVDAIGAAAIARHGGLGFPGHSAEDRLDAGAARTHARRAARGSEVEWPRSVHVAAYAHRFGVDLEAHRSAAAAARALARIAAGQCLRDGGIRERVRSRFGEACLLAIACWGDGPRACRDQTDRGKGRVAGQIEVDGLAASIVESWSLVAPGESLWVVDCELGSNDPEIRDDTRRTRDAEGPSGHPRSRSVSAGRDDPFERDGRSRDAFGFDAAPAVTQPSRGRVRAGASGEPP